jgi:cell division septum initiation protein DivIVA
MNVETIVTLLGIGTAIIAFGQGYDWWKKRQSKSSVDVVSSAIQLLKPYQEEVSRLQGQVTNLTVQLQAAQNRADDLNIQLIDAQTEVRFLRAQVKTFSRQLGDDNAEGGS